MDTGFPHLHPSTVPLLALPAQDRQSHARKKRWVPYARARTILEDLQALADAERISRPDALVIEAPTGNGKSMLLARFAARNAPSNDPAQESAVVPVLHVEVPELPTLNLFYGIMLQGMGAPPNVKRDRADLRTQLLAMLRTCGTRVLVVDECHNLAQARRPERDAILAFLRALGNDTNRLLINVVFAGTEAARSMVQSDQQLLNRADLALLPTWRDDGEYRRLLAGFEALLPLREPSGLADDNSLAARVLERSEGAIGQVFTILSRAAVLAIGDGTERITHKVLDGIRHVPPQQRRRGLL